MLANAGVNINDSVQVRNYLNSYYNRNYSYAAYSQVLSGCANQTLNYVLALPGVEAEEAKEGYRFGFNGKENDNETYGVGNSIAFEARIYDSRLGRFLSVDPWTNKYSWQTPYAYHRNTPVSSVDWNGFGDIDSRQAERKVKKYERKLDRYAKRHGTTATDANTRAKFDNENAHKRWMYISGNPENNGTREDGNTNSGVSLQTRWYSTSAVWAHKKGGTTTVTVPAQFGPTIPITDVGNSAQASGTTTTTTSTPFIFGPFATPRTGEFFVTNMGPLPGAVGVGQNDAQNNVNAPGTIPIIPFQPIAVGQSIVSTNSVNTTNGGVVHFTSNGAATGYTLGFRPILIPATTLTVPATPIPSPAFRAGAPNFKRDSNSLRNELY